MSSLTENQNLAASAIHLSTAVISGAGSGKTRVLIDRIRHIIESSTPLYRILAFTFTEKAAAEIKERLLTQGIIKADKENVINVGTLHAYCAELIRKYGVKIGVNPAFSVGTEFDEQISRKARMTAFLRKAVDNGDETALFFAKSLGLKRLVRMASQLIIHPRLTETRFYKDKTVDDPDTKLLYLIKSFHDSWLEEKIVEGKLYFNDLEYLAYLLLNTYPEIQKKEQNRFEHILVDEFQDINPIQGAIIRKIHDTHANKLFIVGDPKQSIYRFRNADVGVFFKFVKMIEDNSGQVIHLNDTFRMAPEIVSHVNRVFGSLFGMEGGSIDFENINSLSANREGQVRILNAPKNKTADELRKLEARFIAQDILDRPEEPYSASAILLRSGKAITLFQSIFEEHGIPVLINRTSNLLEAPVIRDLIHIIGHFSGDNSLLTQVGVLKSLYFGLSEKFIHHYVAAKPENLLSPFTANLFIDKDDYERWSLLRDQFENWDKLVALLSPLPFLTEVSRYLKTTVNAAAAGLIEEFLTAIGSLPAGHLETFAKLYASLKSLRLENEEIPILPEHKNKNAVTLMTVHASKGLEFDNIYLPQLYARGKKEWEDYIFDSEKGLSIKKESPQPITGLKVKLEESPFFTELKTRDDKEETEETKRLLYVAMTRAKRNLSLFIKTPSKKSETLNDCHSVNEWLWFIYGDDPLLMPLSVNEHSAEKPVILSDAKDLSQPSEILHTFSMAQNDTNVKNIFHTTVSEIESFHNCERQYNLRHIQHILSLKNQGSNSFITGENSLEVTASEWGTLVHEVLEFLDFKTLSNRETVVDQALVNQHINDPQDFIRNKILHTIDSILGNGELFGLLAQNDELFNEWAFSYQVDDILLKGTIDRLSRSGNDWQLMDYKTDKIVNRDDIEKKIAEYEIQLKLYALAATEILGIEKIRTHLLFVDGPFVYKRDWNKEELLGIKIDLKSIVNEIKEKSQKQSFSFPKNTDTCYHCPYLSKNYCGIKDSSSSRP